MPRLVLYIHVETQGLQLVFVCWFSPGLLHEKKRDFGPALDVYLECLNSLTTIAATAQASGSAVEVTVIHDLKAEVMIRTAILKKDLGLLCFTLVPFPIIVIPGSYRPII